MENLTHEQLLQMLRLETSEKETLKRRMERLETEKSNLQAELKRERLAWEAKRKVWELKTEEAVREKGEMEELLRKSQQMGNVLVHRLEKVVESMETKVENFVEEKNELRRKNGELNENLRLVKERAKSLVLKNRMMEIELSVRSVLFPLAVHLGKMTANLELRNNELNLKLRRLERRQLARQNSVKKLAFFALVAFVLDLVAVVSDYWIKSHGIFGNICAGISMVATLLVAGCGVYTFVHELRGEGYDWWTVVNGLLDVVFGIVCIVFSILAFVEKLKTGHVSGIPFAFGVMSFGMSTAAGLHWLGEYLKLPKLQRDMEEAEHEEAKTGEEGIQDRVDAQGLLLIRRVK